MGISPKVMKEIFLFIKNSVYSLRSGIRLEKSSIHTVQFRGESTVYLGLKILELIAENIKSYESVDILKAKKLCSKNLSILTMQDMHLSCWFFKLITFCWRPLLPYCFKYSKWIEKKQFIRTLDIFVKIIIFYSFVTSLIINYLSIYHLIINYILISNVFYLFGIDYIAASFIPWSYYKNKVK